MSAAQHDGQAAEGCASCGCAPTPRRRRRRPRETPEIAAGVRRQVLALGKRVAEDDPNELGELLALRETVEEALRLAVNGQRRRFSWAEIGHGLGVARQVAQRAFGGVQAAS